MVSVADPETLESGARNMNNKLLTTFLQAGG